MQMTMMGIMVVKGMAVLIQTNKKRLYSFFYLFESEHTYVCEYAFGNVHVCPCMPKTMLE